MTYLQSFNIKNFYIGLYKSDLTLKALGFFLPVEHWGGVFHPPPHVRLDPEILES